MSGICDTNKSMPDSSSSLTTVPKAGFFDIYTLIAIFGGFPMLCACYDHFSMPPAVSMLCSYGHLPRPLRPCCVITVDEVSFHSVLSPRAVSMLRRIRICPT